MENAAEALKIVFAMLMFVLALTLSISSFSSANGAVKAIVEMKDRETEYTYITPSPNLTRTVSGSAIIPTLYNAYRENIEVYFYDRNGLPLYLYYKTDSLTGERVKDDAGNEIQINYINLALESYGATAANTALENAIEHLDILMNPQTKINSDHKYYKQFLHTEGLYDFLKDKTFVEELGEYYEGEEASEVRKRIIKYTLQ